MTDAPERIWAVHFETRGAVKLGDWADTIRHFHGGVEYVRADLAAQTIAEQCHAAAKRFSKPRQEQPRPSVVTTLWLRRRGGKWQPCNQLDHGATMFRSVE